MTLRPEQAKALIERVMATRDQEMTCDACLADVAEFVEMQLTGKPLSDALQAVQAHLDRCHGGDAGTTVPAMMSSCKPPFVHEGRLFLRLRGGLLAEGNQRTCVRSKKMACRGKMLRSHGV